MSLNSCIFPYKLLLFSHYVPSDSFKLLFSLLATSSSLWPHGLQHTRLPCSFTISQSLLKFMSIESVMLSNHYVVYLKLIQCWMYVNYVSIELEEKKNGEQKGQRHKTALGSLCCWPLNLLEQCLACGKCSINTCWLNRKLRQIKHYSF